VSALVLPERVVSDDEPPKGWFEILRMQAEALREANETNRELIENMLDARRQERDKLMERRIRELARDVVQEQMFDAVVAELPRRNVARKQSHTPGHVSYTAAEFDKKLREAIKALCDPRELDRLTVKKVLALVNVSPNTLRDLLKDYGYAQPGETPAKCLHRLADEWHPEWRGINRQRF
jgi:AraC-like DNA-binding protein